MARADLDWSDMIIHNEFQRRLHVCKHDSTQAYDFGRGVNFICGRGIHLEGGVKLSERSLGI